MSCIGQFVIVEGIDGSGKTTLAERVARVYRAEYQHVGPPREDMSAFAEHVRYALDADERGRTVFDRFHLGCFAYGPVFRPERDRDGIGDFRRAEWDFFEELIRPHCLVVLCDPGWAEVEGYLDFRDPTDPYAEYEEDRVKSLKVYERFLKAREVTSLRVVIYDFARGDEAWDDVADAIEEKLTWIPG